MENIRDNTKAEHSENSKKKHKDISNAEKDDSENFKKNLKIIQIQTKNVEQLVTVTKTLFLAFNFQQIKPFRDEPNACETLSSTLL